MTDREKFEAYDKKNPKIWEAFKKFAFEAIDAGHERISHWLIMNRVRWETEIVTNEKFKISNNYIAYYARKWQDQYPDHAELFKTKKLKYEDA